LVSEPWDWSAFGCTYYDSTTTPSTAGAPDFGDPDGSGHYCWAAGTAGYGASPTGMLHAYGLL
jgi:hypothetical protein